MAQLVSRVGGGLRSLNLSGCKQVSVHSVQRWRVVSRSLCLRTRARIRILVYSYSTADDLINFWLSAGARR